MSDEYDDDTDEGAEYTEADLLTASHLAALQERLRGERALVAFAAAHNLPASAVLKAWDESKHKRDHGKFSSTGGSGAGDDSEPPAKFPSAGELASAPGKDLKAGGLVRRVSVGGRDYVVKRSANKMEAVASDLAKIAGVRVPKSQLIEDGAGGRVLVQELAEGRALDKFDHHTETRAALSKVEPKEIDKHVLFDYLLGNTDVHRGNYIVTDDGQLSAIDKEMILGRGNLKGQRFEPPALLDLAGREKEGMLREFDAGTIKAMAAAGHKMAEHLEANNMRAEARQVRDRAHVLDKLAEQPKPTANALYKLGADGVTPPHLGLLGRVKWHLTKGVPVDSETLAQFESAIRSGDVRAVLESGDGFRGDGDGEVAHQVGGRQAADEILPPSDSAETLLEVSGGSDSDRVSKAAPLPDDGHTPAEVLDAALAVAQRAIAEGIDPEDALHALYELSFGDTVQKASGWDSAKHPRGDDGKFVKVSDIKAAKKDPAKAAALRAKVTNPEERKKLDHALHSDEVSGSTRDIERHHARQQREKVQASRAVGRELRIKLADQESRGEGLNPDDLRAVIPHLSQMTHEELGRMRAMLQRSGATFGGKRLRAEKVEALTQWALDKASGKTDAPAPEATEPVANAESGTSRTSVPDTPESRKQTITDAVHDAFANSQTRGEMVPMRVIRDAFKASHPNASDADFNEAILEARRNGSLHLVSGDDEKGFSPEEWGAGVKSVGENFVYAERTKGTPPRSSRNPIATESTPAHRETLAGLVADVAKRNNGLAPIHELRKEFEQKHPNATRAQFNHAIRDMRANQSDKFRVTSIDSRSRATRQQLQDSVDHAGESLFYAHPVSPAPDATGTNAAPEAAGALTDHKQYPGSNPHIQKINRELAAAYHAAPPGEAKDALHRVLSNTGIEDPDALPPSAPLGKRLSATSEDGMNYQRDAARELALAWDDTPEARAHIEPALRALKVVPVSDAPKGFDASQHQTEPGSGLKPGDAVEVTQPGWSYTSNRGTMLLVKPKVRRAGASEQPTGTNAAPKTRLQALAEKAHAQGTPGDDPNTEYATPRDQYSAFVRAVVPPSGTKPDSAAVLDYLSKLPDHARERLDQHFRTGGKSLREVEQFHRQAAGQVTPEQVRAERQARADAGDAARAAMTGSGAALPPQSPVTPPTGAANSSRKRERDPNAPKVEYVRAAAGGQVSEVDGKFYRGGQLMPVHGKYSGMEKPPKGGGVGTGDPVQANSDGEGDGGGRGGRAPQGTPEERRARAEAQSKWQEMQTGPMGRLTWLGDTPNSKATRDPQPVLDKWREFAAEIGPAGVQHIVSTLEPQLHSVVDSQTASLPDAVDAAQWYKDDVKKRAEEYAGYGRSGKKHEREVPGSHYAHQLVSEMLRADNAPGDRVDVMHRMNTLLKEAATGAAAAPDPKHVAQMDKAEQQQATGTPRAKAEVLLSHWRHHTTNGRTAEADEAARRMEAHGAEKLHAAGATVPFDARTMEAQAGVKEGQPVRVTRHGWGMPGDALPLIQAQVEPVASGSGAATNVDTAPPAGNTTPTQQGGAWRYNPPGDPRDGLPESTQFVNNHVVRGTVAGLPITERERGLGGKVTAKTQAALAEALSDPTVQEAMKAGGIQSIAVDKHGGKGRNWTAAHTNWGEFLIHPRSHESTQASPIKERKEGGLRRVMLHEAAHGIWDRAPLKSRKDFEQAVAAHPEVAEQIGRIVNIDVPKDSFHANSRVATEVHSELQAMRRYDPARFAKLPEQIRNALDAVWKPTGTTAG